MVSPVSSTDTTDQTQAAAQSKALSGSLSNGTQGLGQDAFLKLLVAQISHQDPLKPMDDTAFVAQLAQFSSLEQSIGINTRLDALATQERGIGNTQIAALVGKTVTVKGNTLAFDGSTGTPTSFTLGGSASGVDITISDAQGNAVRTLHQGPHAAGLATVLWDGKNDTGTVQPPGAYSVVVSAKDAAGAPLDVSQQTTGVLQSISYEKGYPELQLDNGVAAPASDLLQVIATKP